MDTDVLILVLATGVAGLWAAVLFARQCVGLWKAPYMDGKKVNRWKYVINWGLMGVLCVSLVAYVVLEACFDLDLRGLYMVLSFVCLLGVSTNACYWSWREYRLADNKRFWKTLALYSSVVLFFAVVFGWVWI